MLPTKSAAFSESFRAWIPEDVDPEVPTTIARLDIAVAAWVAHNLGFPVGCFDPCTALGVVYRGELIAGVVYYNFRDYRDMGGGAMMESAIFATSPRWMTRRTAYYLCAYPFLQLGVTRWHLSIDRRNKRARDFVQRAGWKLEGIARRGFDGRKPAAVFSMLPEECSWLGEPDGQQVAQAAGSS